MIEVRHLTKLYGNHTAVSDLSFTIENGVIYGFLGPNGAGKSTTMNIITGCLGTTEGEVLVDGHSVSEEPLQGAKFKVTYRSNNTETGAMQNLGNFLTDENGQFRLTDLTDGWYTITGFRLPSKPTEKGIYIHNSKKTIVK